MFDPKINFWQHPPLKSLSAASRRQAEMGEFSQVGVPGGPGAPGEKEDWPAPTMPPVLCLQQLNRLLPGCNGQGWWDSGVMAASSAMSDLVQSKPSCLKLSYFMGLYLKYPISHGPPGSGTETRTSDI